MLLFYNTNRFRFIAKIHIIYNVYMWKPFALLVLSNLFMTIAWYGHLKYKNAALWTIILISWGIAFVEYCFLIPANRIGSGYFTVTQLKVAQEVITLLVFALFSIFYFRWNHFAAFCLLICAVFLTFKKW